jgi:uncharacterized protein (TIGR02266 family)
MAQKERSHEDTRQYRRQTIRVLVDYRTSDGLHCDYATTLGAGGMFLQTQEALSKGDVLKLRFRLPGYEHLHELEGRVVWVRAGSREGEPVAAPGAGVQFVDSTATAQLARELEDYEV